MVAVHHNSRQFFYLEFLQNLEFRMFTFEIPRFRRHGTLWAIQNATPHINRT